MATKKNSAFINKEFDWDIFKTVLKRKWLWLPSILLIFLSVAYIYLRYTKPIYQSVAVIQVGDKDQGKEVLDLENINSHKDISEDLELLKSEFLFSRAIRSLNINISYFSRGKVLTMERYFQSPVAIKPFYLKDSSLCQVPIYIRGNESKLFLEYSFKNENYQIPIHQNQIIANKHFKIEINIINKEGLIDDLENNEFYFTFNNEAALARRLLPNLSVEVINPEAKTIQISYKSNNSQLSRDVTAAVFNSFFKYDEEAMKSSSDKVLSFIDQQLDSIQKKVSRSKDSIEIFQIREQLPNPEAQSADISGHITALTDQLFQIESDLQKLRLVERKIDANPNRLQIYQLIPELIGTSFESSISNQIEELYKLLEKKDDLSYSMTNESAEYKLVDAKVRQKVTTIRQIVGAIKERSLSQMGILNEKIGEYQQKYISIPAKQMELSRLENIQELNSKYYDLLMDKKTVYQISNEGFASKNIVLQQPVAPIDPTSPNRNLIYTIAIFLGLFFGSSIFLLFYLTYNEINGVQDLENILSHAVILGTVPKHKNESIYSQLLVVESPKSTLAEAFRNIRTNLQFVAPGARIYAISSSISGEGKTFVCLNLAGIIALSGKKVIVLDLDLRKPKIHHGFNTHNNEGMSNILIGKSEINECIQKTSLKTLDFISSGAIPPNPSELIMSQKMDDVLEELKKIYDVIMIDNPPIGLVSDGISMMIKADCPIYIFKSNYSKRSFAVRLKELHEIQKINSINVILNAVNSSKKGYGYGYGYGYGNYSEEQHIPWWKKILNKK